MPVGETPVGETPILRGPLPDSMTTCSVALARVDASATRSRWRVEVADVRVVRRRPLVRHLIACQWPMPILERGAHVA